jgi:hypothetical protein
VTEAEWLESNNPGTMVECLRQLGTDRRVVCHLTGKVLLRKIQLFVCASCRLSWADLHDGRSRAAIEVAERHADGLAKQSDLRKARKGAEEATRGALGTSYAPYRAVGATKVAGDQGWNAAWSAAANAPISLLRCVFGNPFRPVSLDPACQTPTVGFLAQAAYDERQTPSGLLDPTRLAVLSDAFEEAGCSDAGLLTHLRAPGPHVRGCWPLDHILGKS